MNKEFQKLQDYIEENPNDLSPIEIRRLQQQLKSNKYTDLIVDFLLYCIGEKSRQEQFALHVISKVDEVFSIDPILRKKFRILEVGSSANMRVSKILANQGFNVTCIDPKILKQEQSENFKSIRGRFDLGFDISDFDLIIGEEPCQATEYIVRACKIHKKPFILTLCAEVHKIPLTKQSFKSYKDWHVYLANLDRGINLYYEVLHKKPYLVHSWLEELEV